MTPLKYLKTELDVNGDFLDEWKRLDEKDKAELKEWAEQEMASMEKEEA